MTCNESDEWWTLDEAIAWVKWRNINVIRAMQNKEQDLFSLRIYPKKFFSQFYPNIEHDPERLHEGEKSLHLALILGELNSRGCKNTNSKKLVIPSVNWIDLKMQNYLPILERTSGAIDKLTNKLLWSKIEIQKSELIYCFPLIPLVKTKAGRKKESGSYNVYDKPIIEIIRDMIIQGESKSPHASILDILDDEINFIHISRCDPPTIRQAQKLYGKNKPILIKASNEAVIKRLSRKYRNFYS